MTGEEVNENVGRNHAVASADPDSGHTGDTPRQGKVRGRYRGVDGFRYYEALWDLSDVVCFLCECVSGYGRPPSVQECSCRCHDTSRWIWQMKPWRSES